jgi:tRNA(Ile)-lysidine synthase
MSELLQQYQHFINQNNLFRKDQKLLIAVSGGLDSSVLVHLTLASGFQVELAHCNFKLRGDESDRDENFVRNLAKEYGVTVHVNSFDTENYSASHGLSIQEAARELRYTWFEQILNDNNLQRVLTAHHADDNVETVMMNIFKGTGMSGLKGILPLTGRIARPLLFASRKELETYALHHAIGYVDDSSNILDKYARNFFRLNIIPLIEQLYPETQANLRNNLPRFRDAEQLYRESIERKLRKLVKQVGDEIHIPVELLRYSTPLHTIIFELVHPYGFTPGQIPDIIKLMDSETGKYIQSSSHRLIKNRNWLILSGLKAENPSVITIEEGADRVSFPGGTLLLVRLDSQTSPDANQNTACIDGREVQYPLILRQWKPGDYFYPLGMQKKKKLSRFFIDSKLSRTEKEKIWVVESSKKIIWVVGMRVDDRVKLTPSSKSMLKLTWQPRL